jgi:ABC-type multidrug transport system fused ATPase/permease subunit
VYGTQRVMEGAITPGTLIVFMTYTRNFYKPLKTVVKHTSRITRAIAQMERVTEILDVKEGGVTDRPGARPAPQFQGQIEFRQVSFGYEPGQAVLQGVQLTLPAGQVTAIVGPTGTGKTTLASLIPRLYDPSEGAVLIDGHDIREYTLQSLRAQVSLVLQESVLLQASIAENIAYGRSSASFQDIVAAARTANAHDFIMALPQGYDTVIGELGIRLSGGQRQRLAIARALLKNAPILILDEATSSLDNESERLVQAAIERLMVGRTVLVIAHRLSTIQRADRIVVIDTGHVVEEGRHAELLARNAQYRRLYDLQFHDAPLQ